MKLDLNYVWTLNPAPGAGNVSSLIVPPQYHSFLSDESTVLFAPKTEFVGSSQQSSGTSSLPFVSRLKVGLFGETSVQKLFPFGDHTIATPSRRSAPPTSDKIADALLQVTSQNNINVKWLQEFIDLGLDIGALEDVSCIYANATMDEILDHPERYTSMSDLLYAIDAKEDELISCLTLGQKIRYGGRLKRFSGDLWSQMAFFDKFTNTLAQQMGLSPGQGAVDIVCYFLRKDRGNPDVSKALEVFRAKLAHHAQSRDK